MLRSTPPWYNCNIVENGDKLRCSITVILQTLVSLCLQEVWMYGVLRPFQHCLSYFTAFPGKLPVLLVHLS